MDLILIKKIAEDDMIAAVVAMDMIMVEVVVMVGMIVVEEVVTVIVLGLVKSIMKTVYLYKLFIFLCVYFFCRLIICFMFYLKLA